MQVISRRLLKLPVWILLVVLLLVAARAALPWGLKRYINQTLDGIRGYYGYVEDVDVALWRGSYQIQGVELQKTNGDVNEPFFSADEVEIALDWGALWNRRLVTRIELYKPKLQFVQCPTKASSQTTIDDSWQKAVMGLYPFEINRFRVIDGLVRYKDDTSAPKINMYFSSLDLSAENISNADRDLNRLPSDLRLSGTFLKSGKLRLRSKLNFLSEPMEADVNASIDALDLKEINDFAKAYGNFDFEKGRLDVALELAASKARYSGYVKTVMRGIDIVDWSEEQKDGDSVGHLLWEGLVGSISAIFENQRRDQFAARISLDGARKDLQIDSWATIGSILRNAFIKAMSPELEQSVEFSDASRSSATRASDEEKENR